MTYIVSIFSQFSHIWTSANMLSCSWRLATTTRLGNCFENRFIRIPMLWGSRAASMQALAASNFQSSAVRFHNLVIRSTAAESRGTNWGDRIDVHRWDDEAALLLLWMPCSLLRCLVYFDTFTRCSGTVLLITSLSRLVCCSLQQRCGVIDRKLLIVQLYLFKPKEFYYMTTNLLDW